jgi:hypothetical protein
MNQPQSVPFTSRKLKKSLFSPAQPWRAETRLVPCGVLASFRPSTLKGSPSDVGNTGGALPFAKIHTKGERPTRSAVCTSSDLHSLRPCWTNFLSILQGRGVRSLLDFAPWAKEMGSL